MLKVSALAITCAIAGLGGYAIWRGSTSSRLTTNDATSIVANASATDVSPIDARPADVAPNEPQGSADSGSSPQASAQTIATPATKRLPTRQPIQDQACLKKSTARCDQILSRVSVNAARCSQAKQQAQYAYDRQRGVRRQGGIYGGVSCGDSGFYYPRCIADARTTCGFKSQLTDVELRIEELRRMGAR